MCVLKLIWLSYFVDTSCLRFPPFSCLFSHRLQVHRRKRVASNSVLEAAWRNKKRKMQNVMTTSFYNSKMIDSDMIFVFFEPSLLKVSNNNSESSLLTTTVCCVFDNVIVRTIISIFIEG